MNKRYVHGIIILILLVMAVIFLGAFRKTQAWDNDTITGNNQSLEQILSGYINTGN